MARLYANENFPVPAVEELRRLGHNVLTTHEAGMSGQVIPDDAVLDFGRGQGRAILTLNRRHFVRLHQSRPDHAGIIVCTVDPDFVALPHRIHQTLDQHPHLPRQLIRINRPAS